MPNRRNNTPNLADLEGATSPVDAPGVMPPLGTPALVETKIRYNTNVDPGSVPAQARQYSDDLRELAGEEIEDGVPVLDPLTDFCQTWAAFTGYSLSVTRLPDPITRRTPGRQYNLPCLEIEAIGTMPFDPNNLVSDLQIANGNSGGAFRLYLRDQRGQLIEGGYLDRILIPDPPRDPRRRRQFNDDDYDERPRYRETPPTPPPPQKSETELMVENAQRQLFTTALARALDPPKAPEPVNPLSQLSVEDQLAFNLLKAGDGNTLNTVIQKIAAITQQPDHIDPSPGWKDKLADAGINLITHNPAIITQATDIITRAATAILTALAPRTGQQFTNEPIPVTQPVQQPPAQRANPAIPAQVPNTQHSDPGLPETPQDDDNFDDDDPELYMLEELTKLMLSEKPLSLGDPVIQDLHKEFPQQFELALKGIAATPSGMLINYICGKSEFVAEMFNSSLTGPHLRNRLEELKALIKLPPEAQQAVTETLSDADTQIEDYTSDT